MRSRHLTSLTLVALLALAAGREPEAQVSPVVHVDAIPAGPSVAVRVEEIRRRIQGTVVYPPSARARGLEGVARVRFSIRRDGTAEGIELFASTNHPLLDRAAERGVRDAAPLPWVWGRLEVPVRFALGH